MDGKTYKIIELVGTSSESTDAAVQNAISRASETIRNMSWFEVVETRGSISNGSVSDWQVTVKIGFRLDSEE